MTKIAIIIVLLGQWFLYATGRDGKPTGKLIHIAIHAGYAAFILAVIAWL